MNATKAPNPIAYVLDAHNVDYDVSYVNVAYTPAAIEPYNNKAVGYVGTIQTISTFKNALNKFLGPSSPYMGWPQFVDSQNQPILKVPSALEIYSRLVNEPGVAPPPDLTPLPPCTSQPCPLWPPIQTLQTKWQTCTKKAGTGPICPLMRDVRQLLQANYDNYVATYPTSPSCDKTKPIPLLTRPLMMSHLYGWTPFGENCSDPKANLLENTPGYFTLNPDGTKNYAKYQSVKDEFDRMQYWPDFENPNGKFDPYVVLIHGKDYVNAPNVYAYSVDDGVGNMQVTGDGLIIAVGGPFGLPNPSPATPPINVGIGYGPANRINFTKYGICKLTPDVDVNPSFASFSISATTLDTCPVSFVDNMGQFYTFKLKSQPPYPVQPSTLPPGYASLPANFAPVDCSGNQAGSVGAKWCYDFSPNVFLRGVYTHTVRGTGGANTDAHYVVTPAPNQ